MKLLDAFKAAAAVHAGQVDKAGAAYIEPPVRVMLRLPTDATDVEKMAALLPEGVAPKLRAKYARAIEIVNKEKA